MKIKDAKVFVCSPSRNFVTLKIVTDEGVSGLLKLMALFKAEGKRITCEQQYLTYLIIGMKTQRNQIIILFSFHLVRDQKCFNTSYCGSYYGSCLQRRDAPIDQSPPYAKLPLIISKQNTHILLTKP